MSENNIPKDTTELQNVNPHWFTEHANIVTLVSWMRDNAFDVDEIVWAVEKPWHYGAQFLYALRGDDWDWAESDETGVAVE